MNFSNIGILFDVARQQVDNIVIGNRGDVESIDVTVVGRVIGVVRLGGGYNRKAVLRARGYDWCGTQGGVARIEEDVVLREGVLGVARRFDIGYPRMLDAVILGMGLVEIVVRVLASIVAHPTANRDAGYLEGRGLLGATLAGVVRRIGRRVAARDRQRAQRLAVKVMDFACDHRYIEINFSSLGGLSHLFRVFSRLRY